MASTIGLAYVFHKKLERLVLSIPNGYPESKFTAINGWHKLTNRDKKELEQINLQKFVVREENGEKYWQHRKYVEPQIKPCKALKPPKPKKIRKKPQAAALQLDELVAQYQANYIAPEPPPVIEPPVQSDAAPIEPAPISEQMPPVENIAMRRKVYTPKEGTLVLKHKPEVVTSPMAAALIRAGAEVKKQIAVASTVTPIKGKDPAVIIAARDRTINGLRKENEALRSKLAEAHELIETFMREKRAEMIELAKIASLLR